SISSSRLTALPLGVTSKRCALVGSKPPRWPLGPRCSAFVCASATPCCLPIEGALRSLGRKPGLSALATFSASTFWRDWCQCMRVLSACIRLPPLPKALLDMAFVPPDRLLPALAPETGSLGNYCRVQG